MANQPTIVVANLDDAKLKASIDRMVNDLNAGLNKMTANTDAAVRKMQASLQSLGDIKFSSGGSDGGSTRRTKKQQEETDAVKQTAKAYDQLAQSQQKSTQVKSARESYYAFVQGYKEQAKAMGELIKTEESRLSGTPLAKFSQETKKQLSQLDVSIDQTKWKINALYQEEKRLQQEALRQKVGSADFERAWLKKDDYKTARVREGERLIELEKERQRIIASDPSVQKLDRDIEQTRAKIQQLIADEKRLQSESLKQTVGSAEFEKLWNQKYTVRDERIKEQERLVQLERERQNLVSVDPIRTQLANLDGMRAEHERLLNIMKDENVTSLQQVSAERKVTEELNKQMQKIFEIDSRKKASAAFQSISGMDSSTLERAEAKLKVLEALKKKVHDTDLFSAKNMQNLDAMISYQRSIVEKYKNAGASITKDDEEAIRKAAEAEKQWAENIKKRGQIAQETSRKMLRMLSEEANAGGSGLMGMFKIDGKDISAVKELSSAIKDMQNAYNKMSDSEKESAVGRALKRDIENAKEAIRYVSAYNALASGLNRGGVGNQQQQLNMERLRQIIKQLTEDFSKLSIEDVKAGRGNLLIDRIQRTSRALQQLQAQMNRPTSLDKALKLPANTLDEIAYKMQMLSNYRAHLNMFDPKQKEEIDAVNKAIEKLRLEQNKIMGQNKEMLASNNALVRSFNYMKNRLAFYFTVGASTQFVKSLIDIRSQYEMNERALGILINSAERGTQIFKELSEMALVSPYTLIELSSAAKQLVAYDIAAKDVVDTTRRLADMAAAVGVPMERLTYALGQIKAYGYLNSRDARMFANAGIPLVKQLADYYTQLEGKIISTADVYDRMKKKAISYNDVMSVVTKMTDEGGKFFDFQAKMAETLKVRLANLTLAWNNMLNEIGENQQGILTSTIGALKELFLHWKDINNVLNTLLVAFGLWKTAQAVGLLMIGELNTAMGAQVLLGQKLGKTLTSTAATTKSFFTGYGIAAAALLYTLADLITTSQRNSEEIEKLNKVVADGAKEASEALDKMLHSSEMVDARLSAINNKLSSSDATKAWERIREQLELSALTSKDLIAQLMLEPDLNKRVADSFTLAEKIQEATSKLSDLNDSLQFTQDSALSGMFGEGIVSDIEDYNNHLKHEAELAEWAGKKNKTFWENAVMGLSSLFDMVKEDMGSSEEEAKNEITKFAKDAADLIKEELGDEGLKDKIQVNEAIARVLRGFEQQFPQIRGKGKALFETMFNDIMAEEFGKSFDKQAYYYNKFLDQLKKDHASAFGDVTDDILKDTHKWSSAQMDAIKKTADKVKKDLPEASQDAINEILRQLNSTEFKVRIVEEMATTSLDKVQQQFKDKYINKPWIADEKERERKENEAQQKYGTLMRKNTESNVEYEKRISDERKKQLELSQKNADIIEKNKNKQDEYSKAVLADAQAQKAAADEWLATAEEIENAGGYDFRTKQESKTKKDKKDHILDALKQEISLVEKLQSDYDKLAKSGVSQSDALATIRGAYGNTIKKLNTELGSYGLPTIDITRLIVGKDPNKSLEHFKNTLSSLIDKGMLTLERSKEVEAVIEKLTLSAKTYNLDMITKGLNNELGKLKDEYELAVELDANPELGSVFADMMGLGEEQLKNLPKDYEAVLTKLQGIIDSKLGSGRFDLARNLSKAALDEWLKMNQQGTEQDDAIAKTLNTFREYANKVRLDETKKQVEDWNKLLEKYAEYEYKKEQIRKQYEKERATAEKKGASKEILDAITNRYNQESAKLDFEQFQKTPEWIAATGDLAGMTHKALGMLIDDLTEYKLKAKNLNPKQIKEINKALKSLYSAQRKDNPFLLIANALDEAQARMDDFQPAIDETKEKIAELENNRNQGNLAETAAQIQELTERLKELEKAQKEAGEIDAKVYTEWFNTIISFAQKAADSITEMMDALGGKNGDSDGLKQMMSILGSTGQWAAVGAQLGGTYGAIIGGAFGMISSVITAFADEWSGNKSITQAVERSERAVRRLELAYVDLQHAIDEAYGTATIGAQKAAIANKELQLVELKRQLELEKSRKSKNRDEDRIIELRKEIKELEYDIRDSTDAIVNDLMGISSVGDALENLMGNIIDTFRQGSYKFKDIMKDFKVSINDMIANMVMKMYTTQILQPWFENIWSQINSSVEERGRDVAKELADYELFYEEAKERKDGWRHYVGGKEVTWEEQMAHLENKIKDLKSELIAVTTPTVDDIKQYAELLRTGSPIIEENLKGIEDFLRELGLLNDKKETSLSALQAGIQGITEDTAGAIESYLNIVSQRMFLHTDLLTEIRDAVQSFDMDIQVATLGQILLQLQASYQVQQSIQMILEGVLVPSGRAFAVELIS